jgi:hypothetical protein
LWKLRVLKEIAMVESLEATTILAMLEHLMIKNYFEGDD